MSIKDKVKSVLSELQESVIGVFITHGHFELVIEEDDITFEALIVQPFGGCSTASYSKIDFNFIRLPQGYKSLAELVAHPLEFSNWYFLHLKDK